MALLEVARLDVDLPTARGRLHAVRGVDLTVERGETVCLVGESGCGKSMTSLALMDLLPAAARRSAAHLRLDGIDLLAARGARMNALRGRRMAMIFQEPMTSLNPSYTIGDQLTEGPRRHLGEDAAAARARAVRMLERVGIANAGDRLGQYPHQLSGGLRQRVMIAMALICEPELLIADEPTTALDVTIQAQILRLIKSLQAETGIGVLLITHDLGVVAQVADRVAVMYAGQIVEHADTAQLFAAPRHPYTHGLMRCVPVPGRTAPGGRLGTIPGVVPSLVDPPAGCGFHDRCAHARPDCAAPVAWRTGDHGHGWRCVLDAHAFATDVRGAAPATGAPEDAAAATAAGAGAIAARRPQ